MGLINLSQISITTEGSLPFQLLNLSAVTFSAFDWGGDTPSNLIAIADGDTSTATTWGRTYGGGNKGIIQADFGQFYNRLLLELQLGLRMNASYSSGEANWSIEAGESNAFFFPLWEANKIKPGSSERICVLHLWGALRYLRLSATDTGAGQSELRWYSLRAWNVTP